MAEEPFERDLKGLSLSVTAAFVVAEMAGSGVLALPKAMANAGWTGIFLLLICCINTLYAGICLGRCWTILEERYSEYKTEKNRHPYAAIAFKAYGKYMRYFVSFSNNFTLLGVSTVFLLLASQLIGGLAHAWGIVFCHWVLILAIILTPLMWLGTPDDFWPAALLSLTCLVMACVFIFVGLLLADNAPSQPEYLPPTTINFFLSFGTILFSFGGATCFPTFQNDMKDRSQFPMAATIGFIILLLLFLPISIAGYVVYGAGVDKYGRPYLHQNIVESLPDSNIKTTTRVLLALQLFFAFLLVVNSPAQEFEEVLKIPKKFGWKRIALRTGMMMLIVFVAQTIPKFGKILNFIGGSTATIGCSILPCFFYMKLCAVEDPNWTARHVPLPEKVYLYVIIVLGVLGGSFATFSAMEKIFDPSSFSYPCYVNITAASMQN